MRILETAMGAFIMYNLIIMQLQTERLDVPRPNCLQQDRPDTNQAPADYDHF
jgi:hypothetical protein